MNHGRRTSCEIEVALYELRALTTIHRANVPQPGGVGYRPQPNGF